MSYNEKFIDAIDTLNKCAYELIGDNAKGWARLAYQNGIIDIEETTKLSQLIDLRNMMGHGGSSYITMKAEDVSLVEKYIALLKKSEGKLNQKKHREEKYEKENVHPRINYSVEIFPLSEKSRTVTFNKNIVNLNNVKYFCCSWGSYSSWPSIELTFLDGTKSEFFYDDDAVDFDGDSALDYCNAYNLFYFDENDEEICDVLEATRQMLMSDSRRALKKCDHSVIYLDSLTVNTKNVSQLSCTGDIIDITLKDGEQIGTQYNDSSTDHKGNSIAHYARKYNLYDYTKSGEFHYDIKESAKKMANEDYKYAFSIIKKTHRRMDRDEED